MNRPSLDPLRGLTVPTLANAVETFGVLPPNEGYNRAPLTCHFPAFGMLVGFAVTARVSTDRPPGAAPAPIDEPAYWRWLEQQSGPLIAVVEDIDDPPGGAMWGEWNANVHRALGCIGTITHGAVRDLDALERLGFHAFSTAVSVGHGYGAFVEYGEPVTVTGCAVATGDVLVADRHGMLRLPAELDLADVAAAGREIDRLESEIFTCCQRDDFSVDRLVAQQEHVMARWPGAHHAV
jgi:4-hydroxy-4-methyl-2-oxoglutarate aldolase